MLEYGGCSSSAASDVSVSVLSKVDITLEKDKFTNLKSLDYSLEELKWLPMETPSFDSISIRGVESIIDDEATSGIYVFGNAKKRCRPWSYGENGVCYGCPNFGITLDSGAVSKEMCFDGM